MVENQTRRTRVVVAMSGGIDSAVTAALLRNKGYTVIGLTLKLYDCADNINERSCCGLGGLSDALAVAGQLDIPHYVIEGEALFEKRVLRHAWNEYARGRTPNPCVACNEQMKFGLLFAHAEQLDADYVATGHHARITRNGRSRLLRGIDRAKDQSYFLFSLSRAQLDRALLPIGDLTKDQVRRMAKQFGLSNADRPESQDACIAQRDEMAEALRVRFEGTTRRGPICTPDGRQVGEHQGIHRFTVGQRKGLGVAFGERAYVTRIDPQTRTVVVSTDRRDLSAAGLVVSDVRWHQDVVEEMRQPVQIQIRYRHRAVPGWIEHCGPDHVTARFHEPQDAVTPGQAAVFYQDEQVIGGGWIDRAITA